MPLILSILNDCPAEPINVGDFSGRVIGVSDGDTLSVMHDGRAERLRLNSVDAPENVQPFTNRAKQFVSDLTFGKDVKGEVNGQDRYGRTDVFLPDERNLNREIVKASDTRWFRRHTPKDRELETRVRSQRSQARVVGRRESRSAVGIQRN